MSESENYVFDGFHLRIRTPSDGPPEIQLYFKGRPQILTPQESKTLQILIKKEGDFIETKTLAEKVCGELNADENTIHVAVRGLRRIFRDPVKGGNFIQNERNRGYRFLPKVRKVRDEDLDEEALTEVEEGRTEPTRQDEGKHSTQVI